MEKLRKDFFKEQKMLTEFRKSVVFEKRHPVVAKPPLPDPHPPKMVIDPQKLEESILKACIPIKRHHVIVIDYIPTQPTKPISQIQICKAINLNGTPCKCRAKIGKFCAKHAP
jgi:hypothetical protein